MRYLFTLLSVLTVITVTAGNQGGCGTVKPDNYQFNTTEQERSMFYVPSPRAAVRNVPVTYHIVTKTNGTGGATLKTVLETHCMLNIGFEDPQMYFYIYSIDTIKDDALWAMNNGAGQTDYALGYGAFQNYNLPNIVNVYITGQLPGLCGFATFPNTATNGGGLFLNVSCCGEGGQTIPHEMGHYFNLDHTFNPTNPREYVSRTASWKNCTTKGDGFCDTPADPSEDRATCPYTDNATDVHGDVYNPDETNFMSYFNDNCLSTFSPQQQNEMNATLSGARSNLLGNTPPNLSPLDSVTFISPTSGDSTSIASGINFFWHPVVGAKYYLFHLQSATSSAVIADTILVDTAFSVGGLQPNKSYKFYARAISYGNVCESAQPYQYVKTSVIKATFNVVSPGCTGEANGSITVAPSNGTAPYSFLWNNGQTTATAVNLASGNYSVTITDNNGKVATASLVVNNPVPVSVTINKVGNNLNAYGAGGTAPYTYTWSNGVNGQFNNNVPFGNYTVTVTDAKGCTTTETFVISSSGIDLTTKVSMKVFPNPASKVASFNIQVDINERTEASITLLNVNGEVVQQFRNEFAAGTNNTVLNIEQLPSGFYFLQFRSDKALKTEKISIIR